MIKVAFNTYIIYYQKGGGGERGYKSHMDRVNLIKVHYMRICIAEKPL
jgi:hypothetical protein